ncbi:MAG TPA: EamA family transporter [Gemmatimonadales bacterium]|nr:EamA family transporter [Gemmatimonadales bacterium]
MPRDQRVRLVLAFAAIYVVWGSTYLAIRYAVATIPPHLMAALRYASAGGILVALARLRGAAWPTRREWGVAVVAGLLLLTFGNGSLSWAEQRVPSGLAALILAGVPLATVGADWLRPGGSRPAASALLGLLVGLVGVAVLVDPGARDAARVDPVGAAGLAVATLSWAVGTVYSRHVHGAPSPLMGAGASMLTGSAGLFVMAVVLGQTASVHLRDVSARSLLALAYLSVFGAVLGFTAYFWLVRHTTPALVTTYAYVNPVVALLLGWAIEGEPVTARVLLSATVILGGVLIVTTLPQRGPRRAARRSGRAPESAAAARSSS